MGKPQGRWNRAKNEVGQATFTRGLPSGGGRTDTDTIARNRKSRGHYWHTAADADTTEDHEGTYTIRLGSPPSMIIGNISSIEASSSESISCSGFGDCVIELAPSRNSQRGYGGVTKDISSVSGQIFFVRDIDIHDGKLSFLPIGWRAERVGDEFILSSGSPARPEDQEMENDDWSGERGWSPRPAMPTYPNPQ